MSFTIPTWILWTAGLFVGIPLLMFILSCAVIGYSLLKGLTQRGGFY